MTETLKQQAERYLGTTIKTSEWDSAKAYAEHKLELIIKREGDADGARRDPRYLAQLIAETVSANRYSYFTYTLTALYEMADKKMGIKKGQPAL